MNLALTLNFTRLLYSSHAPSQSVCLGHSVPRSRTHSLASSISFNFFGRLAGSITLALYTLSSLSDSLYSLTPLTRHSLCSLSLLALLTDLLTHSTPALYCPPSRPAAPTLRNFANKMHPCITMMRAQICGCTAKACVLRFGTRCGIRGVWCWCWCCVGVPWSSLQTLPLCLSWSSSHSIIMME